MLSMRAQHAGIAAILAIAVTVAAAGAAAGGAAPKGDLFDEIYQRSLPMASSLKTIRARFTETTTSSLLAKPLVAEGTLVAVRPTDLLITYTKPDRKILRMDAKKLLFIWPDRHIREESDIEQAQKRVQHYFIDKSPDELRKHFTIQASDDTQKAGTYLVSMTPTRKQIKEGVSRIDLWIDKQSLMLTSMRMTFPNGDTKTMVLQDVEINVPVDAAMLNADTK
jgi:outer membrane lipoprotein-sorting protein